MNLSTHMKIIYDIKHRYTIRLKIGNKFLNFSNFNQVSAPSENHYLLYHQRKSAFIMSYVFDICSRYHNLTNFYNKACITKKEPLQ